MGARLASRLRWSYRKNRADLLGLCAFRYPAFVRAPAPTPLRGRVPVFVFHTLDPATFEAQLRFLRANDYETLAGDELLGVLRGVLPPPEKAVVLTVDDGTATLYTVGYPLLRRYGYRAVSFIIPGLIPDTAPPAATLADVEAGRADAAGLLAREQGAHPLCSWAEIREMHASGVVDFQAHSTYHQLVCVSPQLVDFMHPAFDRATYGNVHVPVYDTDGTPDYGRDAPLGTPVYRTEPRLAGRPQYFDPPTVRQACAAYAAARGGATFFAGDQWRPELTRYHAAQMRAAGPGRFESAADMHRAIVADLRDCKARIETQLDGAAVRHLAFPWFIGSPAAVDAAGAAGFEALYWGLHGDGAVPRPGTDPRCVSRLEERYLWRLPGAGRRSLGALMRDKWGAVREARNGRPTEA